ncbi:hypothetical protein C5O80_12990 [Burkholderia sp. SRS-46]|nr:hypothetical protein C5O80_12990 [Burkholderia sp. SRS-46]
MTSHTADTLPQALPIVRGPHARRITVYGFHDFAQLARDAGVSEPGRQCIFSDLSCGPWRGHWLARELCRQLDLPDPQPIQPDLHAGNRSSDAYADTVSQLIDAEGGGDRNFATAHDCASRIAARVRAYAISHVFVVAPQNGHVWGSENLHLLRLLADAAQCHGFDLWCIACGDGVPAPAAGIEWVAFDTPPAQAPRHAGSALAGLVREEWLANADSPLPPHLRVRDGSLLIAPNARSDRPGAGELQRLGSLALPAYLQTCLALHAPAQNVEFLLASAGQCFAEGGYDAALTILDRIDTGALDPLLRAAVEARKQNIAIALMKFERAAQGMLPDEAMPDAVKASLYQSKAWGLVMTGHARVANSYFELARQHFDPDSAPRLALYLLNISALAKLKSGDVDGALALEKEIESRLQDLPGRDWHLIYINCLNLARIYKKIGALDEATLYYRRAFFVTSSARTESDLLYMNLCHAQLDNLRGDTEAAVDNWLRAAIHWLSNPLPEALAPRVAQAVLGKPLNDREADVEQISAVLSKALGDAATARGIALAPSARTIGFARLSEPGQAELCIATEGWAIAASWQKAGAPPFAGAQYDALNRLVSGLVAAQFPQIDLAAVQTLLSDSRCGVELPATVREACWSCWRYGVTELLHAGRHYLVPAGENDVLARFIVQPSGAIASIVRSGECLQVRFKRYLAPIELTGLERTIVEGLDEPLSIAQLAQRLDCPVSDCAVTVRRLEDRRVVVVG